MYTKHTFHIPVMGTGFTLDTPLKVSPYGMDSVVSIVDDVLIENLRKTYCEKFELPYQAITNKIEDFRAKRITSYLNLLQELAEKKFKQIKDSTMETGQEIKTYLNMLPDTSALKEKFAELTSQHTSWSEIRNWAAPPAPGGRSNPRACCPSRSPCLPSPPTPDPCTSLSSLSRTTPS